MKLDIINRLMQAKVPHNDLKDRKKRNASPNWYLADMVDNLKFNKVITTERENGYWVMRYGDNKKYILTDEKGRKFSNLHDAFLQWGMSVAQGLDKMALGSVLPNKLHVVIWQLQDEGKLRKGILKANRLPISTTNLVRLGDDAPDGVMTA